MRVLLITWCCDLDDVSEPEISARWVKEIAKDHEVTLFAVSKPERYGCVQAQFPEVNVIEWRDIPFPQEWERFRAIVKPGFLPYYFRARRFLKKLVRDEKFDVIHHLSPFSWRYPSPAAGLGVPLVRGPVAGGLPTPAGMVESKAGATNRFMFLRKSDGLRLRFDPVLRGAFRKTDHVLMAAPYVRGLLGALPISSSSIEIEHGLAELPDRERSPGNVTRFLFVGRVIATKGVRLAIEAFSRAACNGAATLTIVGDGEDMGACRAEATQRGLDGKVHFLGWLPKHEVAQHYREADVFVFPSFREPTGGVLLEAMSYGLPLITCAYGGPDYMADSRCGIKVSPTSRKDMVRAMANAMDRLASDVALRDEFGNQAYSRAKTEFGWDAKRFRMGQLYKELAQK